MTENYFLQDEIKDFQQFDLNILKEQLDTQLTHILRKIPYSGRVLSRSDLNRVTVNVGKRDGLKKGSSRLGDSSDSSQSPSEVRIFGECGKRNHRQNKNSKSGRHVELRFGRDGKRARRGSEGGASSTLWNSSRTRSRIRVWHRHLESAVESRDDAKVAFGKNAHAWRPLSEPTIGQVGARLGLSRFTENSDLSTGSVSGTDSFTPIAFLEGELWITSNWMMHANLKESIFSISTSSGNVSESLSAYEGLVGYRFRFGPSVWSPYAEAVYRLHDVPFVCGSDNARDVYDDAI